MSSPDVTGKIQHDHLSRKAVIYIRQSTISQDRKNTGSKARQYDLVSLALKLGWTSENVVVADQDRATSASSMSGRESFKQVLTDVALGHVGAIFCLMVDRLSRSDFDWQQILKICQVTDTLIIDEDRVWDLNDHNDLTMMGIKGAFSASELRLTRSRCRGGILKKASSGELRFRPPTGLIHDQRGQLVMDPDEQIQQALHSVFELFNRLPSARAVVTYFKEHGMKFPTRHWGRGHYEEVSWGDLLYARIISILHNPAYAGAYVWGRNKSVLRIEPESLTDTRRGTTRLPMSKWQIVRLDSHESYISWEQYLRNLHRISGNKADAKRNHPGAIKAGLALLHGILLCGKCGRRMFISYHPPKNYSYDCRGENHLGLSMCQSMSGTWIDLAVADKLLQAINPAQLRISLRAIEEVNSQRLLISRQWDLQLERARYEAELVRRHLLKVEPELELVTRNLRRDLNARLEELEKLERERDLALGSLPRELKPSEHESVLELARDLPAVWHAETTTPIERKQIVRLLIKAVTLTREGQTVNVVVRWQTGACSRIKVSLPHRGTAHRSAPELIALIRELANDHTNKCIADYLNKAGWKSKKGEAFTANMIQNLRFRNKIPNCCPARSRRVSYEPRGDGRLGTKAVARLLNVGTTTINRWCHEGRLDCIRGAPQSPLWIKLSEEDIRALRRPLRRGHSSPPRLAEMSSTHEIADSLVSDSLWDAVSHLMPPEPQKINGGRRRISNRAVLCAIIFILRHEISWWVLPSELGFGTGINLRRRFLKWQKMGSWQQIQRVLVNLLPDIGELAWRRTFE